MIAPSVVAGAAATASANAVAHRPAQPASSTAGSGKPNSSHLRIGIIGIGGRGTGAALQAIRADKNCTLVAVGDVFQDRVDSGLANVINELGEDPAYGPDEAKKRIQVPRERQFTGFDCHHKVIESGVDVVLLTSYPSFRPAHLKAAIDAGKHVFAEKPLAVDGPGMRTVYECGEKARRENLALLVGFCWRFNHGMREAFDRVHAGEIGGVVTVHTNYHTGTLSKRPRKPEWSDFEFQMRNWWHFTWLSGDHIVEQAIHSVDRMAWALNDRKPTKVTCLGGRAARSGPEHGNVYDHFSAIYEYDDGSRAFHTCRQIDGCPSDNSDYIYGEKGSMTVNGWAPSYVQRDRAGKEVWKGSRQSETGKMYQTEHDDLFASIRAGTPINDCERGANSTLMAIMARMAAYTGQTVTWDQALNSKEDLSPPKFEFGPLPMPEVAVPGKSKLV